MEINNIIIDQDLLAKAEKETRGQSLDSKWKRYVHLQYIKYIEGVACFLSGAAAVENGEDMVSLTKKDLSRLSRTLFEMQTYGPGR